MVKIMICPKCESKIITCSCSNNKIRYKCISCGKQFNENTKKERYLKNDDYLLINKETDEKIKKQIFNFLFGDLKSKNKFLNRSNVDKSLLKWLNINYIRIEGVEQTLEEIYFFLSGLEEKDRICVCGEKTKFIGIRNRKIYNDFCSNICLFKSTSDKQLGENNSVHRIIDKKSWKENISIALKNKILNGDFTPCVTNSWSHSKIETIINGKIIKHRSSWESFFHIKNPNLLYEKIRIPYIFENIQHNYIVDFLDQDNRILYEIKPNSEKIKLKNKIKIDCAIEWSKKNNFTYKIIDDEWFYNNYTEELLINQPFKEKLIKNLKQFLYENKENKENRL